MLIITAALAAAGCGERASEVVVSETRELTRKDGVPQLFATDDERFRNAKPSPVEGVAADGWLAMPGTEFRQLNYRFGASGTGEVFVSVAGGSVLENANRWLGQFQAEPLTSEEFAQQERVAMLGGEGVWLEAEGRYVPGMGQADRDGYGLAGALASIGDKLITVKMVGPAEEVAAERAKLREFIATLSIRE